MKFTVNQREMLYALNIVSKAVSSSTTLEVLKGVYIETLDNHLLMKSNDLSLSIQVEIPALVEEKGNVLIDFQLFNELVRKLPDDAVTLNKKEDAYLNKKRQLEKINESKTTEKIPKNVTAKKYRDPEPPPKIIKTDDISYF